MSVRGCGSRKPHHRRASRTGDRPGRPAIGSELRDLIRRISTANPAWGSPRLVAELAKLGIAVAKSSVEKYRVLFVFLALAHERRRVLHFDVTEHPSSAWTAQQVVEAFPWDTAPRFLLRDRDGIYGPTFRERVEHMGIARSLRCVASPVASTASSTSAAREPRRSTPPARAGD